MRLTRKVADFFSALWEVGIFLVVSDRKFYDYAMRQKGREKMGATGWFHK